MKSVLKPLCALLVLCICIAYATHSTAEESKPDAFAYKLNADGTVTMSAKDFKRLVRGMKDLEEANGQLYDFVQEAIKALEASKSRRCL